ncbi:MAG: hypothetical protein AAB473_01935 [Patescibacteria group bacterium]
MFSLVLSIAACGVDHSADTGSEVTATGGVYGTLPGSGSSGSGSTDTATEDTGSADSGETGETADSCDTADTADSGETGDSDCTPVTWYRDADEDGYGSSTWTSACDQPTGYVSNDDDLDDSLAVVGSSPTHVRICGTVDIGYEFSFWWDDTEMSESNTWLSTTVSFTTAACEDVADFRPTHLFALNGYYKGGGSEDEWLVGAGNNSHITDVYVMFDDGSFDEYTVDSTGTHTTIGYAYFVDNGVGGGNLYFEAEPDFEGENSY